MKRRLEDDGVGEWEVRGRALGRFRRRRRRRLVRLDRLHRAVGLTAVGFVALKYCKVIVRLIATGLGAFSFSKFVLPRVPIPL